MNKENYKLFKYFIEERENVRIKKEAGEQAPWTDDHIIQKYRFTNVRRSDDKHTRLVHSMIKDMIDKGFTTDEIKIFIYMAVRTNSDGLDIIKQFNYECTKFLDYTIEIDKDYKLPAYYVRKDRATYREYTLNNFHNLGYGKLLDCKYNGPFMINQIAVYYRDVERLFGITLGTHEEMSYYNYGKKLGTGQGLDIIEWENSIEGVYDLYETIKKELPEIKFEDVNDVSNCLCEFSKYYKAYNGVKSRRRKYD